MLINENAPKHPIKVIQFGEGNFLRAFVDWMVQEMNDQGLFNGQVAVVQPLANGLTELLENQQCAYTHYLKGMKDGQPHEEHYINRSIQTTVNPYKNFDQFLDLAAIETAEIIVSNTTEAGIEFNDKDQFDDNEDLTYPGKLTRLLLERYNLVNGDKDQGFLILPCELIDNNADRLKECVLAYVELWSLPEGFRQWIERANQFCNTLVDRIVPGYPRDTIEEIWTDLGYKDQLVVESELFNLWVIEGDERVKHAFPAAQAGCNLLVVDDVKPYKQRKVRILNGAHTSMVPVALLNGQTTVRGAIETPLIESYLNKVLFDEIMPTLPLPKEEIETFAAEVIERFKNPFIKHYLMSISLNSMSKYRTRVLPSLTSYLDSEGQLPKGLVAALASYIVFYRATYKDMTFETKDNPDIIELYKNLWDSWDESDSGLRTIVETVLGYEANWQGNLNHIPGLTDLVSSYVKIILESSIETLLEGSVIA